MKRPLFIIISATLVVILMIVWVYVLFFGSPKNSPDTFTNLDFGDTTDTTAVMGSNESEEQPFINITGTERLHQLTTKPVVGYQEVTYDASSTPKIIYIESGTGQVFSIDSVSGEESRLSGTTIAEAWRGEITPDGRFVMVQSGLGITNKFIVGELSSSTEALENMITIDENIISFQATTNNTFLYAVQTNDSVVGKHYYPISDTSDTLFTIPFREATIDWGETSEDTHYGYPKASNKLEGFVYQIKKGQVKRLPIDGFGLSARGNDSFVIYSKQAVDLYKTFVYIQEVDLSAPLPFEFIPEKCTHLHQTPSNIICAGNESPYKNDVPDVWYQGVVSYTDDLWEIGRVSEDSFFVKLLVDVKRESGRELDIINPMVNQASTNIYFTNKNDHTLWLYEMVSSIPSE